MDANTLLVEEKCKTLRAKNVIKEKWNGIFKGRTCTVGSSQKQYFKQD